MPQAYSAGIADFGNFSQILHARERPIVIIASAKSANNVSFNLSNLLCSFCGLGSSVQFNVKTVDRRVKPEF